MIIHKKDAIKWLYNLARTDEQLDFLMEGEKRMKKEKDYDIVYDYVLTFPCPPEFKGFIFSDSIFFTRERAIEYGLYELLCEIEAHKKRKIE